MNSARASGSVVTAPAASPAASAPSRERRWAALGAVYLLWGSTYLAIKVMVETVPPLLGAGVRFLTAGGLLAGWVLVRRGRAAFRTPRAGASALALTALLLVVGGPGLTTVAERSVPSGLAALIIASVPLWVVLWRVAFRERIGLVPAAGVVVGLGGVGVLVLPLGDAGAVGGAGVAGILLMLLAALAFASGSFWSGRFSAARRLPDDALATSAVQMLIAGGVLTVAGLGVGELGAFDPAAVSPASIAGLLYLIGPGSLVVYTIYVWLLGNAPVSQAATYAYVNPVVAVALGWLVLDERLTPRMLVGAAVIVVCVVAVVGTTDQRH